jgi:glucose repression regulatory protein TUP1
MNSITKRMRLIFTSPNRYEEEIKRLRLILDSRGHEGSGSGQGGPTGPPHLPTASNAGPPPIASAGSKPGASSTGGGGAAPFGAPPGAHDSYRNGYDRERGPNGGEGASKRIRVEERDGRYAGPPSPMLERERERAPVSKKESAAPSPYTAHAQPAYAQDSTSSTSSTAAATGNATLANLSEMDPEEVPKDLKKEGSDWWAIFNPKVKRQLDVNLVHTLMHESVVCCVRFSPDGKFLATGCNKSAQIYDTKTGAKTCVLTDQPPNHKGDLYIRSVCFSPDGRYLATGAEDRQIRIWNISTKKVKHMFTGHKQEIYSLDFSKDGRIIASGSGDKTVRIWDVDNGQLLHTLYTSPGQESGPSEAGVTSVSISSDNRLVAAGALDTLVRVWDARTGQQLEKLRGHKDSIYSVSFAPDGRTLVSGSLDKTLKVWDLAGTVRALDADVPEEEKVGNATCANTFMGHKDYVLSVSCSPDGMWIASGSKDRGVQFWEPRTGQAQFVLQGHKNSVIAINLSPAGNLLASGSGDFNARIWSYERMAS